MACRVFGTSAKPTAKDLNMNTPKIIGIILVAAGLLAMTYGGFTYTKETHEANIGPLKFSVKETETVNIPLWVGIGSVVGGVLLLVGVGRK
jgi:hypothetical protein